MLIALINQLWTDGHITDVEASRVTSDKLFKTPLPPTTTTLPITLNTNSVHDGFQITSTFCNSNCSAVQGTTTANQKVFLASADDDEEEATWLASEKIFKMPSGSATTMPLNANRNNVHNGVVKIPSSFNDSTVTCNNPTTSSTDMLISNVPTHECEVESQPTLQVLPMHALTPVPLNNHDTHDPGNQQTMIPTDTNSDHLQLLSDHELKSAETTCAFKTTAVDDDESAVPSIAIQKSDSGCCSIDNEPILNLIVMSEYAKETAEGTYIIINTHV